MKINSPQKRLNKFWGKVDEKHSRIILKWVKGQNILDLGAGYGTTSALIMNETNYNCTAIDLDDESIKFAKDNFPKINYQKINAENLPFESGAFDTLILRDALHHFWGEANFEKVKNEMLRVLKKGGRVIFFDPNVNFILKFMRKIASHRDEECTYEQALRIMSDMNLKVIEKKFNTLYSLPLSGGYVGLNFVPDIKPIESLILKSESFLEKMLNEKIARQLCWRYLILGDKL